MRLQKSQAKKEQACNQMGRKPTNCNVATWLQKKRVGGPIESGENVCKKYAKNAALRTEKSALSYTFYYFCSIHKYTRGEAGSGVSWMECALGWAKGGKLVEKARGKSNDCKGVQQSAIVGTCRSCVAICHIFIPLQGVLQWQTCICWTRTIYVSYNL